MNTIIIEEQFYQYQKKDYPIFRIYSENEQGRRSTDYLIEPIFQLKRGMIFCGEIKFYLTPNDIINSQFVYKFGNYFGNFQVYLQEVNSDLNDKIELFNKAKTLNPLKLKHKKELLDVPIFNLGELIQSCKIVMLIEAHFSDFGPNFILFQNNFLTSKDIVRKYLDEREVGLFLP